MFIGEWAAHLGADKNSPICDRKNNWYSALAEAAFLTGVENNADHVVMTCYAPLLAKINHQQWQPNLIWFDNETVYGSPSYYVQKMFSENIGDYTVEAMCDDTDLKITASVSDNSLILKLVNISDEDKNIEFNIDADFEIEEQILISGELTEENSIKSPKNICPVRVQNKYALNKYSIMIAKLKLNKK